MFLVCNGYLVRGLVCLSHWSKMAFVVLRAKTTSNWQWITVTHHFLRMCQWIQLRTRFLHGYGSIPINTNFRGMNIHLPAILMFTRGTRFWHTATYEFFCLLNPMIFPHDSPWFHHGPSVPSRAARAMPGTWPSACGAARLELTRKRRTKPWEDGEFMGNSWRFHGDFTWFQHIRLPEHATDSRICQEKDLEMVDYTYPSLLRSSWKHRFPKQIDPRQGMPED